jgi:hypothetical protein
MVGEKPCACVADMMLSIKKAKSMEEGLERKERIKVDGFLERAGLMPW